MQFIHLGTHTQAYSNIPYSRNFYNAATVAQPRRTTPHFDTTIPNTMPIRPRRPQPRMLIDDGGQQHHSFDTETLERIIEYTDQFGTVIMTQTVDSRVWALHEAPYARRQHKK